MLNGTDTVAETIQKYQDMAGYQFPARMTVSWLLDTSMFSRAESQNVTIGYTSPVIDHESADNNLIMHTFPCTHSFFGVDQSVQVIYDCLLYTSPSPRDKRQSRMPSSA